MFNNFYNNQPMGGYGFQQQPAGVMFQQQVKQPKYTNPLTPEQIAKLRNNGGGFSLKVDQIDLDRAICTHRDPQTHQHTLVQNNDGTVTCTICGSTFTPCDNSTKEDVEKATNLLVDILQTAKMLYLDMPDAVCADFFQMIPFIKKTPQLYQIAVDNMRQYDTPAMQNGYGSNAFGMLGMITNPMQGMGIGMQPQMQMPMGGMPMMGGVPQTPFMQQQMAMTAGNPFQSAPAADPNATQQQPAQQAPAADTATTSATFQL